MNKTLSAILVCFITAGGFSSAQAQRGEPIDQYGRSCGEVEPKSSTGNDRRPFQVSNHCDGPIMIKFSCEGEDRNCGKDGFCRAERVRGGSHAEIACYRRFGYTGHLNYRFEPYP